MRFGRGRRRRPRDPPHDNERSHRAALVLPHVSRMLEDGGVEERVRLVRPAARETMARAELDASTWREAEEEQWRALWEAEIAGLPSHTESRFWLVTGTPVADLDRVPDRNMRVRRLTADSGEHMIGAYSVPQRLSSSATPSALPVGRD